MEKPSSNENYTKEELELKNEILGILKDFNWDLYYEILYRHMRKSGRKGIPTQPSAEEIEESKNRIRYIREAIDAYTDYDLDPFGKRPDVIFDSNILSIADAAMHIGRNGRIRINVIEFLNYLNNLKKIHENEKVKFDFDITSICILKVLFHELVHLSGSVHRNSDGYSSINEAITEMLSFKIMKEYLRANGNGYAEEVEELFFASLFHIYENEKSITGGFILFLTKTQESNMRTICDAFYRAYLNQEDFGSPGFINQLPLEIQKIWTKFLNLKPDVNNMEQQSNEIQEIFNELEDEIEKIK